MIIAKQSETRGMYEKNLKLLTPWMRETAESIGEEELWRRVQVRYNEAGYPVCTVQKDGSAIQVTSQNPVEEARIWRETIEYSGAGAVFVYGCGFGYTVFELFEHKTAHTLIVVFEEDICLFKAMLYYFDLEPIIRTGKLVLFPGGPEHYAAALEDLYSSIYFISCTSPVAAFTHLARRNYKREYLCIHADVFTKLSLMAFYVGNDHKDNLMGFVNMLGNIQEIVQAAGVGCLQGQFEGVPAFIVSSGPSLDKNIAQLKEVGGRGIIFCAESSATALIKNGIAPDAVVVIERVKNSYEFHFKGRTYPKNVALLALSVVDPRVLPAFKGAKIPVFRDREILNLWMDKYFGDGHVIDAGANVSHMAMELAVFMGADPVIFVGQDFAYGAQDVSHSRDTVYFEEKGREAQSRLQLIPAVTLEGNDGQPVHSNRLWADFKQGLEQKLTAYPQKTFINATEGGAKITGTKICTLMEAIHKYCKQPKKCNIADIASAEKKKDTEIEARLQAFLESLKDYSTLFRETAHKMTGARLNCMGMRKLLKEQQSGANKSRLEAAYHENVALLNEVVTEPMLRCFAQQVIFAYYYRINCLRMIDTDEKIKEIFSIHHDFFQKLAAVFTSVSMHMEDALQSLTGKGG
jgi:hypothetical protein